MRVICVCLSCLPSVSQTPPGTLLLTPGLHSAEVRRVNLSADMRPAGPFAFLSVTPDATSLPVSALTLSTVSAATQKYPLLLPATHSCSYPVQNGLLPTCLKLSSEFTVLTNKVETPFAPFIQVALQPAERFHWKGALWQSFGFLVAEHAFRIANDPYARYLLLHKQFWHDYWASANEFHMSHWGDGDDFIVNYIGHPMEGAVAGYIFLNNDPKGGSAHFGKSSEYWYSRLKAMTWAAAFSTYFEIGPILSEAAIGNEGGYTYVPGSNKNLGKHLNPPTNNTGWVDFVITPTVGTGWIVLEDVIEREVVDRLAQDSTALKYKILRGSLAPSHTFANMFAGNTPWFRYRQQEAYTQSYGARFFTGEIPSWKSESRHSLGVQFISMSFLGESKSCSNCKQLLPGYGFDFNYRLARYVYLNSLANLFPGSGSRGQHGGAQEGLVGVKLGSALHAWGLFFNVRNGFIHYDKALVPGSSSSYGSTWRYALDLSGAVEWYFASHSALRLDAGTTLIHYLQGYPDPSQRPNSVLSTQYYSFHGSPYLTTGYAFRF